LHLREETAVDYSISLDCLSEGWSLCTAVRKCGAWRSKIQCARQQAAAKQGASKLAHSKTALLECGSSEPPWFGEACFALRNYSLLIQKTLQEYVTLFMKAPTKYLFSE
jgi:hypothetical protein